MKKQYGRLCGLILLLAAAAVSGCGKKGENAADQSGKLPTKTAESKEADSEAEEEPEKRLETVPEDPGGDIDAADIGNIRTLQLESGRAVAEEWDEADGEDILFAKFRSPLLNLAEEQQKRYPALQNALDVLLGERLGDRFGVYEEAIEGARDGFEDGFFGEDITPGFALEDVRVRRADEHVVSLLFEGSSYLPFYQNREAAYCRAATFDTETGEQLSLADVVTDVGLLPELIEERLEETGKAFESEVYGNIGDCFAEGSELAEELVWTLDYDGITFYFNEDVISWYPAVATISFEREPELVKEKYRQIPACYGMELPCNTDYIDLDWMSDYRDFCGDVSGFTDMRPTFVHGETGDYLYVEFNNLDTDFTDPYVEVFSVGESGVEEMETLSEGQYLGYGMPYGDLATLWWSVLTNPEDFAFR